MSILSRRLHNLVTQRVWDVLMEGAQELFSRISRKDHEGGKGLPFKVRDARFGVHDRCIHSQATLSSSGIDQHSYLGECEIEDRFVVLPYFLPGGAPTCWKDPGAVRLPGRCSNAHRKSRRHNVWQERQVKHTHLHRLQVNGGNRPPTNCCNVPRS